MPPAPLVDLLNVKTVTKVISVAGPAWDTRGPGAAVSRGAISMTGRRSTVTFPSMHHVGGSNVIAARISTVAPQDADPQYSCAVSRARLVERALATGARVS
jgi:hypothetical protein